MLRVNIKIVDEGVSTIECKAEDLDDVVEPRQRMRAILHDMAEEIYREWLQQEDTGDYGDSTGELEFVGGTCHECGHPLVVVRYGNGDLDRLECINCKYNDQ